MLSRSILEVQSQMRCNPTQLELQPHTPLSQLDLAIFPPFPTITSRPGLSYNLPFLTEPLNKKFGSQSVQGCPLVSWLTKCAWWLLVIKKWSCENHPKHCSVIKKTVKLNKEKCVRCPDLIQLNLFNFFYEHLRIIRWN